MTLLSPTLLRRTLLGLLVLFCAALLVAGWYAYRQGFTHKWRQFVVEEFRKRGVEIAMRRLTLDPFRGIVAKEVRIFETRERRRTRAVIEEVRLVVNFANLAQGKPFIDALDLYDVNLNLPLDPKNPRSASVEVRHLRGRLFLPPQQLHLNRLEADLYGIHVTASGRVINPQIFHAGNAADAALGAFRARWGKRLVKELQMLQFSGATPQLAIRFSGDLATPGSLFVEANLSAEKVRRKNFQAERLQVQLGLRDGVLSIPDFSVSDRRGTLRAQGSYLLDAQRGSLQLHSDLDAQALLQSLPHFPELDETVFYEVPRIDLTARWNFADGNRFHLLGAIEQARFAYRSVLFEGLRADVSWDGTRWAAQDLRLTHASGEVTGELLQSPEGLRARLTSTLAPEIFAPLRQSRVGAWLQQLPPFHSASRAPAAPALVAGPP